MLSKFRLEELGYFIETKDISMLASIPGIGRKTAEKVVLELMDRVKKFKGEDSGGIFTNSQKSDAILGLIALGYKRLEAEGMIKKSMERLPGVSADQLIRDAIAIRK
jgi:Holliday junction DNA helicase RuvA